MPDTELPDWLKGQCHEIFWFWFFSWISFPQAPEYTSRAVSNFFENSQRYSLLKVDYRYRWHRWQIWHRHQRHRRQILLPVSLVLLIPVANLPPVSTTPVANCFRYQRHRQQICHRCRWHRWQTMGLISGCRYLKVKLKAKMYIYVNSTFQRCPNKIIIFFFLIVFALGGSPTPHPISSRPHFVCKLLKFFWLKIFFIYHRCQRHRWSTLSCEYFREFSKKFETVPMGYSEAGGKLIDEKNQKQKIWWHCPFNYIAARFPGCQVIQLPGYLIAWLSSYQFTQLLDFLVARLPHLSGYLLWLPHYQAICLSIFAYTYLYSCLCLLIVVVASLPNCLVILPPGY